MLIGPELRTLRIDDGPQRTAQAAMHAGAAAWRDSAPVRAVDEALAAYDAGAGIEELPVLTRLMSDRGAREFTEAFVADTVRALATHPLGHVALRHAHGGDHSSLILSRARRVTLSLETRVRSNLPAEGACSCVLNDIECREVVLEGAMEGRLIRARERGGGMTFSIAPFSLRRGDVSVRSGRREVLAVDRIAGCLTTLRLQRRAEAPVPSRAYDLATGALVRQACGEVDTSRHTLMVALLGQMARAEDAPLLADIARAAGDPDLRWEAVRECLGLDTATGFRLLCELGRRIGDPIQGDASALRARLLAQHPQLAALEVDQQCPA